MLLQRLKHFGSVFQKIFRNCTRFPFERINYQYNNRTKLRSCSYRGSNFSVRLFLLIFKNYKCFPFSREKIINIIQTNFSNCSYGSSTFYVRLFQKIFRNCFPFSREYTLFFFIRTKFIRTQAFGHPEIKNTRLSSAIKLRTPMSRWGLYAMIKCTSSFVYSFLYLQHMYFYKNWFIACPGWKGKGSKH